MSDASRSARRNVAHQLTNHSLRKIVGFNLILDRQSPQTRSEPPVTTDDPLHQFLVSEVIQPPVFSIALACPVNQSQIQRTTFL